MFLKLPVFQQEGIFCKKFVCSHLQGVLALAGLLLCVVEEGWPLFLLKGRCVSCGSLLFHVQANSCCRVLLLVLKCVSHSISTVVISLDVLEGLVFSRVEGVDTISIRWSFYGSPRESQCLTSGPSLLWLMFFLLGVGGVVPVASLVVGSSSSCPLLLLVKLVVELLSLSSSFFHPWQRGSRGFFNSLSLPSLPPTLKVCTHVHSHLHAQCPGMVVS